MSYSSGYSSSGEVSTSSSSSTDEMFSVNMADVPLIQMATGFIEEPKNGVGLKDTLDDGYYEEEEDESRMGNSSTPSSPKLRDAADCAHEQDQADERSEDSGSVMHASSTDSVAALQQALDTVEKRAEDGKASQKGQSGKAKKHKGAKKKAKAKDVAGKGWIGVFETTMEASASDEETMSPRGRAVNRLQKDPTSPFKRTIEGSPMPIRAKNSRRDTINRDSLDNSVSSRFGRRSPRDELAVKELPEPKQEVGVKAALKRTLSPKNLIDRLSPRKRDKDPSPPVSPGASARQQSPRFGETQQKVEAAPASRSSDDSSPSTSPLSSGRHALDSGDVQHAGVSSVVLDGGSSAASQSKGAAVGGGPLEGGRSVVQNLVLGADDTSSVSRTASEPPLDSQKGPPDCTVGRSATDDKVARRKRKKERKKEKEARAKKKEGRKKDKDPSRKKKKSKRRHKTGGSTDKAPEEEADQIHGAAPSRPAPEDISSKKPIHPGLAMTSGPQEHPSPAMVRGRQQVAEDEEQMPLTGRKAAQDTVDSPKSDREKRNAQAGLDFLEFAPANGILDLAFQHLEEIEQGDVKQFLAAVDKDAISAVNLSYNALKDVPSFADLPNLVRLSLAGNCLMEIPETVQSLSKLQVLDLRYNKLVRLPPEVSNLPNLLTLLLNNNSLQVIPRNIGFLRQLRLLDVSNNVICRLPRSTQELVELRVLNCRDNELVKLPNLGRLTNLTHLDCSGNMINALPYDFNGAIQPFVSMLRLADNTFRSVPMQNLERFRELKYLDLDGNNIEMLPPNIRALTSVQCLFLSRNKISFVSPEIGSLSSLYRLHLDHNRLSDLPDSFKNLRRLRELSLCYNEFKDIPSVLTTIPLLSLKLSSNAIESFPDEVGEFTSLDTLDLSDNMISTLSPSIGKLTRLVTLSLECNLLKAIPPALTDCTKLTLLNIAQNELTSLPDVGSLQKLQDFILWDNRLEDMPNSISLITTFHSLQVTGNPMSNIPQYCHAGGSELWTYLYQRNLKVDDH